MSRYSPTVLPATQNWSGLVDAFNDSLDQGLKRKQDKQRAADAHESAQVGRVLQGERTGKPPIGGTDAGTPAAAPSGVVPPDSQLAGAMGAAAPPVVSPPVVSGPRASLPIANTSMGPAPVDNSLSQAFQAKAPSAPVRAGSPAVDARSSGVRGTMTPGAFDPTTGTFATAHGLPVGAERYVEIDPNHYVDTLAGSGLTKALMEAQMRAQVAEDQIRGRLTAVDAGVAGRAEEGDKGRAARADEGDKNRGVRTSEGDKNRTAALARVEASATAAATRQAAHDRTTGTHGTAMTGNAHAAWSKTMADGIVGVHGGSMDQSMEYFNSDEAKPYRDKGLTAQDIYAAAGRAMGVTEKEVVGKVPTAGSARTAVRDVMGARAAADSAAAAGGKGGPKKKQITADQRDYLKAKKGMSDKDIDALYEVTGAPVKP